MKYKNGKKKIEMSDKSFLELIKNKEAINVLFGKQKEKIVLAKAGKYLSLVTLGWKILEWFKGSYDSG